MEAESRVSVLTTDKEMMKLYFGPLCDDWLQDKRLRVYEH